MGVFNNFGDYNAEEEAARRAENLRILEESTIEPKSLMEVDFAEVELRVIAAIPTVKIEKDSGVGSSYSVNCPSCGKFKVLSSELNSMTAVCNRCYYVFNLEK